jgi:hypothetical protein
MTQEPSKAAYELAKKMLVDADPREPSEHYEQGDVAAWIIRVLSLHIDRVDRVAREIMRAKRCYKTTGERSQLGVIHDCAESLILPDPKPDPLAKAMSDAFGHAAGMLNPADLEKALTAAGYQITKVES